MTDPEAAQETFISHLVELRTRLVRAIGAVLVIFLCVAYWTKDIYSFLAKPLLAVLPAGASMIATDVTTTFFVPVKVSMLVAFMIALPYVLYQMWAFVAPGLYQHEKRLVVPLLFSSTLLFFVGMAFAYFLVFPMAFKFFADFTPVGVTMATDIDKYFNFVLTMFIVFGIAFEVPVVEVLLVKIRAVTVPQLKEIRRYVIVAIFVVAAIVTPPDVFSQLALAIPLCILYELGIILAGFLGKPLTDEEKKAMTDAEMEKELDAAEAEAKRNK
ncbi:MAG: twin-arginine translocase subunit TatC [Betaproteobacteria bacterium]|nr:twin-arginine translocase subunit TatC [Betaproteobacteria bacterium]MBK9607210.1 twin-arginine translocase subunit TatC [Betaproteobacteria bacterium]